MEVDTTGWELAEELPHGTLYWAQPAVVIAVPNDGVVETVELSRAVFEGYSRCARTIGRPIGIVVFVDRLGDQTPEVRDFWVNMIQPDVLCAVAMVCRSFFARAIGSFFMGLRKPVVPTRIFATLEEALAWSGEQSHQHADR